MITRRTVQPLLWLERQLQCSQDILQLGGGSLQEVRFVSTTGELDQALLAVQETIAYLRALEKIGDH